jgi:hypothetical protein
VAAVVVAVVVVAKNVNDDEKDSSSFGKYYNEFNLVVNLPTNLESLFFKGTSIFKILSDSSDGFLYFGIRPQIITKIRFKDNTLFYVYDLDTRNYKIAQGAVFRKADWLSYHSFSDRDSRNIITH